MATNRTLAKARATVTRVEDALTATLSADQVRLLEQLQEALDARSLAEWMAKLETLALHLGCPGAVEVLWEHVENHLDAELRPTCGCSLPTRRRR